jgi:hypothetical protein
MITSTGKLMLINIITKFNFRYNYRLIDQRFEKYPFSPIVVVAVVDNFPVVAVGHIPVVVGMHPVVLEVILVYESQDKLSDQ